MKTKLRVISLFIISTLILSFLPATTVLADDPPEDITDYYNENVPTLNTWQDAPRDYVMTHDYDVSDHENNIFPNLGHVLANRFIFPGDTITETIDSDYIYYILLTGIDEEKYVGITERYATGSGGTNTYTFGVTDVNNCYRKLTFDKLTGQALKAGSGGGQGPTNEGELGDDPYPRGGWASVYPVSITRNITYELHGGIIQYGENPTSVNISNENHDLYVYKPIQEGKHYSYWGRGDFQDNGDGTLKMTLPALSDGDIGPLYAVYVPGNTVKFVAGEGATIHCLSTLIVEAGETFDVRDYVPRRAGYRFDGWYENEDFSGSPVTTVTHFDEYKSVLYAKWVDASPKVSYQTHVQDVGWQGYVSNGASSGTSGESKRLEAIKIKLENLVGGIEYRTHVQDIGWQDFVADDALSGTSGQSKRLEAIQIRLTGQAAEDYDVYYRVHAQNVGWMGWAKNGTSAGTAGYSYRLEAIEIKLVAKGGAAPGSTANAFIERSATDPIPPTDGTVSYKTHVQDIGWQAYVSNGEMSGTSGQSKRLEGIQIKLQNVTGGIEYSTHIQDVGWQGFVADDAMSGTSGQSKRLEAIKIRLTGAAADAFDVYYCVHAQNTGWLDWAKNGESAGTAGFSYRLEAIKIVLVPKGGPAPGATARAFVQG